MCLSHFFKVHYSCLFTCGLNWILSVFSQSRSVFPVRRASLWMCSQPEASQPSRQSAWQELTTQTWLVSPLSLEAKRRAKERGRPGNRLSRKNVRWGRLSQPLNSLEPNDEVTAPVTWHEQVSELYLKSLLWQWIRDDSSQHHLKSAVSIISTS